MTAWTHYWTKKTAQTELQQPGPLDHTASNLFRRRGVDRGDRVYVISFWDGTLKVLGRLDVGRVVDQAQAERICGQQLWDAEDHVMAKPGSSTSLGLAVVQSSDLDKIEFLTANGNTVGVKYNRSGNVERQSFRSPVREITATTARLFDQTLAAGHVGHGRGAP